MPRASARSSDIAASGLTFSELQELWLGPCNGGSVFDSPEQLRDAWARGRAVCMRIWAHDGKRPMGWWHLGDAANLGLEWPGYFHQASYLFEHNALEEVEREQLVARWHKEFEHACSLEDAAARKSHLDWADVPHSLRRQWAGRAGKRVETLPPGGAGHPDVDAASGPSVG